MTFDKTALKKYWTLNEAAQRLSEDSTESVSVGEVIGFVLDGHLPLVVSCPTGTRQYRGQGFAGSYITHPTVEAGVWDVELAGERGAPARQHLEHLRNPHVRLDGVQGAWITRPNDQHESGYDSRQLQPERFQTGIPATYPSAFPPGCVLGIRREALDALLAKEEAVKRQADWSGLTILFMTDHDVQVRFADTDPRNFKYTDMGFADGRDGSPAAAWPMLRTLADKDEGEPTYARIEVPEMKDRKTIELRMKEIRQNLRDFVEKHYPNYSIPPDSNPTPGHTDKRTRKGHYRAAFKVGLASNLRSSEQ